MTAKESQAPNSSKIFRRSLLISVGGTAALLALGAARTAVAEPTRVRPPGGQDEDDFTAKCIKCSRCVTVCPQSVIVPSQLSEGFFNMRTPVMKFVKGYCDFCKKCIDVCPTGALQDFPEETTKIGIAKLTDYCIARRTAGCTKCYEECPHDAITLDKKGAPVIDEEPCTGCGLCEQVCPAHTLQSFSSATLRGIVIVPVGE
ncbi:MAG: 4Fe-4S dicluster domain-containing protein [Burkholderiales bacterium]|nr:4Fe-4S dicluster domain-containing protein [Burkholderiales bacterium]